MSSSTWEPSWAITWPRSDPPALSENSGGWPSLSIFLTPPRPRVPHPCAPCKGGYHDVYWLGFAAMNWAHESTVSAASCPPLRLRSGQALAENARAGHPPCLRCSQNQRLGHPADIVETIGWSSREIKAWVEHTNCFEERWQKTLQKRNPTLLA